MQRIDKPACVFYGLGMKAFWDEVQLAHAPHFFLQRGMVRANFETPARAEALLAACRALGLQIEQPSPADRIVLETVHAPDYLDFLRDAPGEWDALPEHGPELVANVHPAPEMLANGGRSSRSVIGRIGWYTADTACPIAHETWPAACAAASGAIAAADEAAAGRTAYALARPPGHHAYAARAGGHCYLNNAALAAERLRIKGAQHVAILDIDSHHGNGTQGIFWRRADVTFVSVHADPGFYYPWYVGHAEERGAGPGEGATLNLPLPMGTDDAGWLEAIARGVAAIEAAKPDALVISLGFDASKDEPLAAFRVTEDGFARAAERIAMLRRPAAVIQEGGYNTDVIGRLLERFLTALAR
jgi:acetoin utilization deacetylase AcuC-like enzyme